MKRRRNHELLAVQSEVGLAHHRAYVGRTVEVLAEGPSPRADRQPTPPAPGETQLVGRTRWDHIVVFDGPLALDNAMSLKAAQMKGITSRVAGQADVLITPDVESGNILAKALSYFARGRMAGVAVAAKCPIVMPSRSDPPEQKLMSLALGVYLTK